MTWAGRPKTSPLALACLLPALCAFEGAAWADRRVPIAVMELAARGVDPSAASALGTEVSNSLAELRVFRVITKEDIKRLLQLEQTRQQCTGEADAACLAEIGGALGVDFLVYGEISKLGGTYNLSLVLLDIGLAEAKSRVSAKVTAARDLLSESGRATRRLVQPLLADKTGYLVLDARDNGAEVTIDGKLVGVTPLPGRLELPMGPHEILVEKKGFLVWARTIDLEPGQATVTPVALVPSQTFVEDYRQQAQTTRTAAWITAGAGALFLGTGVVLSLVADAQFDDLVSRGWLTDDPTACAESGGTGGGEFCATELGFRNGVFEEVDAVETMDNIALGALIVGGAAAVASAVLFLTGDDPDRYEAFGATPVVGVDGRGRASFRFEF